MICRLKWSNLNICHMLVPYLQLSRTFPAGRYRGPVALSPSSSRLSLFLDMDYASSDMQSPIAISPSHWRSPITSLRKATTSQLYPVSLACLKQPFQNQLFHYCAQAGFTTTSSNPTQKTGICWAFIATSGLELKQVPRRSSCTGSQLRLPSAAADCGGQAHPLHSRSGSWCSALWGDTSMAAQIGVKLGTVVTATPRSQPRFHS